MRLAAPVVLASMLAATAASAQTPSTTTPPPLFGIVDNSFLVEEAFNQDRGVVQSILFFTRSTTGEWNGSFTQEWPLASQRHQISYTLPASIVDRRGMLGDVLVNYRFQALSEGKGRPAFSPRLSVIAPSSAEHRRQSSGLGWQVNLPFSKEAGRVYFHWNAGMTWQPEAPDDPWTVTPAAAGSAILAVRPMFHLMLEAAVASARAGDGPSVRTVSFVPGFRTGWNLGERQIVVGSGLQIVRGDLHDVAVVGYASYELPFSSTH